MSKTEHFPELEERMRKAIERRQKAQGVAGQVAASAIEDVIKQDIAEQKETKAVTEKELPERVTDEFIINQFIVLEKSGKLHTPTSVQALAGIDSDEAWEIRESVSNSFRSSVLESIIGLDSDRAWQMREETLQDDFLDENEPELVTYVASSLCGLNTEKSWEMRERLINNFQGKGLDISSLVASLAGNDSDRAWALRDRFYSDQDMDLEYFCYSLVGLDSDRAWKKRRQIKGLPIGYADEVLCISVAGLDTDQAWELRDAMQDRGEYPLLDSLAGLDNDRAWNLRKEICENQAIDHELKSYLSFSIGGLNSNRAHRFREQYIYDQEQTGQYLHSLNGNWRTYPLIRGIKS